MLHRRRRLLLALSLSLFVHAAALFALRDASVMEEPEERELIVERIELFRAPPGEAVDDGLAHVVEPHGEREQNTDEGARTPAAPPDIASKASSGSEERQAKRPQDGAAEERTPAAREGDAGDQLVAGVRQEASRESRPSARVPDSATLESTEGAAVASAPDPPIEATAGEESSDSVAAALGRIEAEPHTRREAAPLVPLGSESQSVPPSVLIPRASNLAAVSDGYGRGDDGRRRQHVTLDDYMLEVRRRVEPHWRPRVVLRRGGSSDRPGSLSNNQQHTLTRVAVRLDANGRVREVQISGSSGFAQLDRHAVAAFRRAAPFPPPPTHLLEGGELAFEWGARARTR